MDDRVCPAEVLLQRKFILEGIAQLGRLCNWSEEDIQGLLEQVWEVLVRIDNSTLEHVENTGNEIEARDMWSRGMGDLQYWLSLVLGIEVDFVF